MVNDPKQEEAKKAGAGQNHTTFVIAHRLSTVQHADRILVLENGKIVETGTHATLIENGGLYQHLYALQFRDLDEPEAFV